MRIGNSVGRLWRPLGAAVAAVLVAGAGTTDARASESWRTYLDCSEWDASITSVTPTGPGAATVTTHAKPTGRFCPAPADTDSTEIVGFSANSQGQWVETGDIGWGYPGAFDFDTAMTLSPGTVGLCFLPSKGYSAGCVSLTVASDGRGGAAVPVTGGVVLPSWPTGSGSPPPRGTKPGDNGVNTQNCATCW
ncbi:hypothetical protein CFP65_0895 [Kitasatospora sp. MMS16-BH015]|uniref:hypothetical protein n=1 Tax=Kitasatospora sp. MMS16-BH015 TaxID=2018025 RepID=UPI000CA3E054|nr:hypothetical protein [Kitasatospora sp. MMS16-BH015]AUG75817.1 hypothetical protein CFP65_0895 [Kitasatospora sp. MMS16-BH015]